MTVPPEPSGYSVRTSKSHGGWEVQIVDAGGAAVWTRHCADQAEARTFASTVAQHIYWLSEEKFRQYYRLDGPQEE